MTNLLLAPPIAFIIYLVLVAMLSGMGRVLAGAPHPNALKASTYASGERAPKQMSLPGYRPFFVVALLFAVLHLGVLVLATSDLSWRAGVYLVGLILVLLALILR
jgi:NADH:ubiquinone oxidoreductase subunit 3 (subunit A)